jgi:DNA-binding LytR/AlgR family response regulator
MENSTIRYFVLEDQPTDFRILKEHLDRIPELEFVGLSDEVSNAVEQILKTEPDLVFWDYRLIGGNGLQVLEKLEQLDVPLPYCVGAAAYEQIDMTLYNRYQHLFIENFTKPFLNSEFPNRMRSVILKLRRLLDNGEGLVHPQQQGYMFVKAYSKDNPVLRVELGKVTYLEVNGAVVTIGLSDGKDIKMQSSLTQLMTLLEGQSIRQVNRNTAVNLRHVERYENERLIVLGRREPIAVKDGFKRRFETSLKVLNG